MSTVHGVVQSLHSYSNNDILTGRSFTNLLTLLTIVTSPTARLRCIRCTSTLALLRNYKSGCYGNQQISLTPKVFIRNSAHFTELCEMASRRGRTREREGGREKREERREGVRATEDEASREEDSGGERAGQRRRNNFRQFVDNLKEKQHRVVEMRIALVSGFAIAARVLFSDRLSDEHSAVVQGSLLFAGSKSLVSCLRSVSDLSDGSAIYNPPFSLHSGCHPLHLVGLLPIQAGRRQTKVRTHAASLCTS